LAVAEIDVNGRFIPSPLTAREREIATLIGLGLTNRQIGLKLSISERTAGVHVQNILNKLGANNRAQIATWAAQSLHEPDYSGGGGRGPSVATPTASSAEAATAVPLRKRLGWTMAVLGVCAIAVLLIADDAGVGPSAATGNLSQTRGALVFQAKLAGDGDGFSVPYITGDPSASAIRFVSGAVEYSVIKPGGDTGNSLAMPPLPRYLAVVEMSVMPSSNVEFWFRLGTAGSFQHMGDHLIAVRTAAEEMQLAYFVQEQGMEYIGPQVPIKGLQSGRRFIVSVLVDPPHYQVYLDGQSVINTRHSPSAAQQTPGFAIFGDAIGAVRLRAVSVYALT
jgi:DNA-binding CsgD family transcriptional regulator